MWDRLSSLSVHGHDMALEKTDWTVCPPFRAQRIPRAQLDQANPCKKLGAFRDIVIPLDKQPTIASLRIRKFLPAAVAFFFLTACGRPMPAETSLSRKDVVFNSSDGMILHATIFFPENATNNPPGLILLHMAGSSRTGWDSFAARAQRAGYLCLAFDARGHGDSMMRGGQAISYRTFETRDWLAILDDMASAHKTLLEYGADPDNVAVVGASIGANLVLRYALNHPDVAATVMVSPGLDYKGVETEQAIRELGKRPALLVTSQGDSYSAESCATLKKAASGLCELREYAGSAHGTNLLDGPTHAAEDILLWLRLIIGPKS